MFLSQKYFKKEITMSDTYKPQRDYYNKKRELIIKKNALRAKKERFLAKYFKKHATESEFMEALKELEAIK